MRVGDVVLYVESPRAVVQATVLAVAGSGPSGYKVLSVRTPAGRTVHAVPHVNDCQVMAGYWCLEEAELRRPAPAPETKTSEVGKTISLVERLTGNRPPSEASE